MFNQKIRFSWALNIQVCFKWPLCLLDVRKLLFDNWLILNTRSINLLPTNNLTTTKFKVQILTINRTQTPLIVDSGIYAPKSKVIANKHP